MTLDRIERLHSTSELILAVANDWCKKHDEKPQVCGATKEARDLAGNILTAAGVVLCVAALAKAVN